jgi:preprotein translocase subunit SecG
MLFGLVLVVHILVSLILIGVILLQGGRGGLSEALGGAAAQSLFGGGAATVFTRITAICAGIFVITCLSLAYLSTAQGRSVIEQIPLTLPETLPGAGGVLPQVPEPSTPESASAPALELHAPSPVTPADTPAPE